MKMHPFLQVHEKIGMDRGVVVLIGLLVFTKRSSLGEDQNLS